jgi:hypothetical protein
MQQQPHLEILGRTRAQAPALKNLFALSAWCCLCAPLSAQPVSTRVEAIAGTPWKRHTIDNTSQGADGVKLGDWNRDGLPDITTGWEEGGLVRVYTNPGGLKARDPWPQITVGDVADVEEAIFADLDGDGRLEVISGTEGKTRTIFWHRPIGRKWRTDAFPATKNTQMWMQAAAVDLDGMHGTDLLLASKGPGATVGWLQAPEQPGDLAAWTFHPLREAGWIMSLMPHDMDGDGDADVVFTDRKGKRAGVFWLENPGAGAVRNHDKWKEHTIGALGREVMFADLGDVNGDGLTDLAVAVKPFEIFILLRQQDGGWREKVLQLDAENLGRAKAVKIADLNGDGLADLVFTCEGATSPREGVVWLEQQRDGPWLQHSLAGPDGVKFDKLQVLDLDGDGDLDVITCEEHEQLGVVWYENPSR